MHWKIEHKTALYNMSAQNAVDLYTQIGLIR